MADQENLIDKLADLPWLVKVVEETANKRVRIEPPEGELLPAEERLQNALQAILDRIEEEQAVLREMEENGWYESVKEQRQFLQGLDIAWSLVKTESLAEQAPGTQE